MVLFYIFFGWFVLITIGFALLELRPDKERLFNYLQVLKQSCKYRLSFPIVMFFYLPLSIYNSLKKIFRNDA